MTALPYKDPPGMNLESSMKTCRPHSDWHQQSESGAGLQLVDIDGNFARRECGSKFPHVISVVDPLVLWIARRELHTREAKEMRQLVVNVSSDLHQNGHAFSRVHREETRIRLRLMCQ